MAKVKPFRKQYLASRLLCEVCLKRAPKAVHEMTRGNAREASLDREELVLAVCDPCHDSLGDASKWPLTKQLALKWLRSPRLLDLPLANRVRGRSDYAITVDDLTPHLELKN